MELQQYTETYYIIVNAITGYWLSGKFKYKDNAIKAFNERKANLKPDCNPIALIEYTESINTKVIEK